MPSAPSKEAKKSEDLKKRLKEVLFESDYMKFLEKDASRHCLLPWLQILEVVEVERTSETTGRVVCRFPVQREYLNPAMTLHGGLSGGFFDCVTTVVLDVIRKPGYWQTYGTSRSLNITFLRPAAEGEMLRMETEIVHAGKRLCLIKAVLVRERDGAIVSTCEHQKYNTDADTPKV